MLEHDDKSGDPDLSLLSYDDLEQTAKKVLSREVFTYVCAGSGSEESVEANRESFARWRLLSRVMMDVTHCSLAVELLRLRLPAPIMLAPAGAQAMIHPDGELATARAAASFGVPLVLSTYASRTIEEVAEAMGSAPRFFELYATRDRELMASLIHRAENSGYSGLVLTSDQGGRYVRYRFVRDDVGPTLQKNVNSIYFSDPVFHSRLKHPPEENLGEALRARQELDEAATFTWDDVSFIRDNCRLPLILKGVLHPKDAELAIKNGFDAIIVSNYGGRRLDGQAAAMEALPKIFETVHHRIPIILDSGVRSGVDVVKALALGADAVMIGRAFLYGLAISGEQGVGDVIRKFMGETKSALGICGCNSPRELEHSFLTKC